MASEFIKMERMKRLIGAFVAGAVFSGAALAQTRPGDADPYASRPGTSNPYAPRAGDPNPYATKAGDPNPGSVRDTRSTRDNDRRSSREDDRGYGYAKDPHTTHLPYGTSQGTSTRRR